MNFRLLAKSFVIIIIHLGAMENAEIVHMRENIQAWDAPALEKKIKKYLSLAPLPERLDKKQFKKLRNLCVKDKYFILLEKLLEEKNGSKIIDPNSYYEESKSGKKRTYRLLVEAAFHKANVNVRILLEHGADPNCFADIYNESCSVYSPLLLAITDFDHWQVKKLLERGARVNMMVPGNNLPLIHSVLNFFDYIHFEESKKNQLQIVEALLQKGAEPDEKQDDCVFIRAYGDYGSCFVSEIRGTHTARTVAGNLGVREIIELFNKKP